MQSVSQSFSQRELRSSVLHVRGDRFFPLVRVAMTTKTISRLAECTRLEHAWLAGAGRPQQSRCQRTGSVRPIPRHSIPLCLHDDNEALLTGVKEAEGWRVELPITIAISSR